MAWPSVLMCLWCFSVFWQRTQDWRYEAERKRRKEAPATSHWCKRCPLFAKALFFHCSMITWKQAQTVKPPSYISHYFYCTSTDLNVDFPIWHSVQEMTRLGSSAAPGSGPLINIFWWSHLEFGENYWKWSVCRPPLTSVGLSPPIGPQKGVLQPQIWPQHRHRHGDRPRRQKEDVTVSQGTDLCTLGFEPTTLVLPTPFSTGWGTKLASKVCFCVCFLLWMSS